MTPGRADRRAHSGACIIAWQVSMLKQQMASVHTPGTTALCFEVLWFMILEGLRYFRDEIDIKRAAQSRSIIAYR
jgi:hypothetical protein